MGEESYELDNHNEGYDVFPPILDLIHKRESIHSAIGFINKALHFGFVLPTESAGGSLDRKLCFVNSNKEIFSAHEHNLARRNLELAYKIKIVHACRWAVDDMQTYLNEKNRANYKNLPFEIFQELRKYIELKDYGCYLLTSLWIIGTYLQPIWKAYPYLSITGTKRTGKSKILEFLEPIAFNSLFSANISMSSLFRLIRDTRPTFLLDESEKYSSSERQQDMRNILQCGYKRTSGYVFRTNISKKNYGLPERFNVFCPKEEKDWDVIAKFYAKIVCYSEAYEYKFLIHFLRPDSPKPDRRAKSWFNPEKKVATAYLPFEQYAWYLDLLRNEQPVYAVLDSDEPNSNRLRSGMEPDGQF